MPKQYRLIGGVPMAVRTVHAFVGHPRVGRLVLVLPEADSLAPPVWLAELQEAAAAARTPLVLVAGGAARADSVANGLHALDASQDLVLVHDAARPFVSEATIEAIIAALDLGEAAIAAVPLGDTLKAASDAAPSHVQRTVPRAGLWRAQTPQGFRTELLRRAYLQRADAGDSATDEAALVERLGVPIRLIPDSSRNFKVTSADDLALAELIADAEGRLA